VRDALPYKRSASGMRNRRLSAPILIETESVDGMPTPSPFSVTTQCSDDDLMPSGRRQERDDVHGRSSDHADAGVSYSGTLTILDNLEPARCRRSK
jgi:hypothetical protein